MLKNDSQRWGEKKFELLIDLVSDMGKVLDYDHIDKATLRDNLYVPQGYEDQEEQFRQMRKAMLDVLRGQHPVPVTMVGPVEVERPMQAVEELSDKHQPTLGATKQTDPISRALSASPPS